MTFKTTKFFIIFLTILSFAKPLLAQDLVLTWQQCVDLALANNNNLKFAIANEKSSDYQSGVANAGFLPKATANLSSNRNGVRTTNEDGVTQNYNSSVTVTQNLFSGFNDTGNFNQAKANNLIAKANVDIAKAQLSYDLKSSYESFLYAKSTVNLLDEIIKRRDYNLDIIDLRFRGGMENKGSLLLSRAYLEQAKYDRQQAANLLNSSRLALCKVMGMNECNLRDVKGAIPLSKNPSAKIDLAPIATQTPQHIQAEAQEKAAQAGITIAKSGFFPNVDLSLSNGQRGDTIYRKDDYWSLGVNLSYPFFSGGRDYYATQSAYQEKIAAKENRSSTYQQILVDLQENYSAYNESIIKLKVDENFRSAAEMRADIARSKYNNGLLNFEDWDLIETDLINRQKNYLQSKRNRVISEAAWELIQGKGVFNE